MTSRDGNAKGAPTGDACNYKHTTTELSANTDAIDIFHSRVFSDGGGAEVWHGALHNFYAVSLPHHHTPKCCVWLLGVDYLHPQQLEHLNCSMVVAGTGLDGILSGDSGPVHRSINKNAWGSRATKQVCNSGAARASVG